MCQSRYEKSGIPLLQKRDWAEAAASMLELCQRPLNGVYHTLPRVGLRDALRKAFRAVGGVEPNNTPRPINFSD